MLPFKLDIALDDLTQRVLLRLRGGALATARSVVWQDEGQRVLLHLDSLNITVSNGWLLCDLDLTTDSTRRCTLQFVYFLGRHNEGDGVQGAGTVNAPTVKAGQVAERWGKDLQRVIWDGILDVVEGALNYADRQYGNQPLELLGFTTSTQAIHVDIQAGET